MNLVIGSWYGIGFMQGGLDVAEQFCQVEFGSYQYQYDVAKDIFSNAAVF